MLGVQEALVALSFLFASNSELAAICPGEGFAQTLTTSEDVSYFIAAWLPGGNSTLSVTDQNTTIRYQVPQSRHGPVFGRIDAGSARNVDLCIHGTPHRAQTPRVEILKVTPSIHDATYHLSEAGRNWYEKDFESAVTHYQRSSGFADKTRFTWSGYPEFYTALGLSRLYRWVDVLTVAESLGEGDRGQVPSHAWLQVRARAGIFNPALRPSLVKALEQELESIDAASFPANRVSLQFILGQGYLEEDQLDRGEAVIRQGLEAASITSDNQLLAYGYNNLGYASIRRSYIATEAITKQKWLRKSLEEHQLAMNHAKLARLPAMEALILNNMGTIHVQLGQVHVASREFRSAVEKANKARDKRASMLAQINLAKVYRRLGDELKSAAYLTAAKKVASGGEAYRVGAIDCELGALARQREALGVAFNHYESCLTTAQRAKDHRLTIQSLIGLAETLAAKHDWQGALARLNSALSLLAEDEGWIRGRLSDLEMAAHSHQSLVAQQLQLAELAEASHLKSMEMVNASPDPILAITTAARGVKFLASSDQTDAAIALGLDVIRKVESVHAHLDPFRVGPAWTAATHETFDVVLAMLFARKSTTADQMFDLLERSRALNLRQQYATVQPPPDLVEQTRLEQMEAAAISWASELESNQVPQVSRYLLEEAVIGAWSGEVAPDQRLPTLSDVQHILGPDSRLLYFQISNERTIYVLDVTQDRVQSHSYSLSFSLPEITRQLRQELSDPNGKPQPLLHQLAELLPSSIKSWNGKHLILVPHRQLHDLPLSAIPINERELLNDRFTLTNVPSMTIAMAERTIPPPFAIDLAVLADPQFKGVLSSDSYGDHLRSWANTLERLPWSAREAIALQELFTGADVTVYTGHDANRRHLFAEKTRTARILHIASHGYFQSHSPDNNGIILAPPATESDRATGSFVTTTEISAYPFNNELVVVSGCDTAVGQSIPGEGNLSVSRALLGQGAKRVLGTLWPVSDRASARFMAVFYQQLHSHRSPRLALQQAQQKLRSQRGFNHPFYWAPYVLNSASLEDTVSITFYKQSETIQPVTPVLR